MDNKYDYNKHYKIQELCSLLNIEYNKNHPRLSLNKIKMELELEQISKQKYRIVNVLNLSEKEKYKKRNLKVYDKCNYDNFLIDWDKRFSGGVYIIQLGVKVYIGQTKNFFNRYKNHRNGCDEKANIRTKELISLGATFDVLCYEDDSFQRLIKESDYIAKYINDGYDVINNTDVLININKYSPNRKSKHSTIKILNKDIDLAIKILSNNNIFVERVTKNK